MPLYEFICEKGHKSEHLCSTPDNITECPICGLSVKREFGARFSSSFKDSRSPKNSIDVVIGRDSNKKWEYYEDKFKRKEKIMQDNPGKKISSDGGSGYIVDSLNKPV